MHRDPTFELAHIPRHLLMFLRNDVGRRWIPLQTQRSITAVFCDEQRPPNT
jgi:hypothetical protein